MSNVLMSLVVFDMYFRDGVGGGEGRTLVKELSLIATSFTDCHPISNQNK